MKLNQKIIAGIFILLFVFTVSFSYGYRKEIKSGVSSLYTRVVNSLNGNENNGKVQSVNAGSNQKFSKDSATDETVIKQNLPVAFVDRKHKLVNSKEIITKDTIKQTTATSEGIIGKSVKDVYKQYIAKGYKVEANVDEIVCVKVHSKGKFVAKLNGDNYEIYEANENGELELKETAGRVNHKGEDETLFNKDPVEYSTIEEARESLSDFTS
jgi:hypothetical protein